MSSKLDLQLIVDSSESIGIKNFREMMTGIADGLISQFDIAQDKTRVALFKYSKEEIMVREIRLNSYGDATSLKSAIKAVKYEKGLTYTATAMEKALDHYRTGVRNDGETAKVCIVFTDGNPTTDKEKEKVPAASKAWAGIGATVFAVGIGKKPTKKGLIDIAGSKDRIKTVTDFDAIGKEAKSLLVQICEEVKLQPQTTTTPTTTPTTTTTTTPKPCPKCRECRQCPICRKCPEPKPYIGIPRPQPCKSNLYDFRALQKFFVIDRTMQCKDAQTACRNIGAQLAILKPGSAESELLARHLRIRFDSLKARRENRYYWVRRNYLEDAIFLPKSVDQTLRYGLKNGCPRRYGQRLAYGFGHNSHFTYHGGNTVKHISTYHGGNTVKHTSTYHGGNTVKHTRYVTTHTHGTKCLPCLLQTTIYYALPICEIKV